MRDKEQTITFVECVHIPGGVVCRDKSSELRPPPKKKKKEKKNDKNTTP